MKRALLLTAILSLYLTPAVLAFDKTRTPERVRSVNARLHLVGECCAPIGSGKCGPCDHTRRQSHAREGSRRTYFNPYYKTLTYRHPGDFREATQHEKRG